MRTLFLLFLLPLSLLAEQYTPEQIQQQLNADEALFLEAKGMFNPWYTGPLITPSASMMPPANGNFQPYLFLTDNYAAFDEDRKSVSLPSDLFQVKELGVIQTGLTNNCDMIATFYTQQNFQDGKSGSGFGDISVTTGFLINKQTRYAPQVKFSVAETFPTGSYKQLKTGGLDGIGAGAYSTQFVLTFGKLFFWTTKHPLNTRLFFAYQLSTVVNVRGINVYGGAKDCVGKVRPGNNFSADLGLELSLNQNWVAALDVVYTATNSTKFHGNAGHNPDGSPAAVGSPYNDNLSLAPALEYNWSSNLGILAGAWFSVYGRNSLNFASGVISISYSFP